MDHARHGNTYLIRFDTGEVLPGRFAKFLKEESIRGGSFTGIGAMEWSRIAFFDTDVAEYRDLELAEQLEVLSLVGNVAVHDQELVIHTHVTLGRQDGSTLGGHLVEGRVRPTLELTLQTLPAVHRSVDPQFGLPTLDFENQRNQ